VGIVATNLLIHRRGKIELTTLRNELHQVGSLRCRGEMSGGAGEHSQQAWHIAGAEPEPPEMVLAITAASPIRSVSVNDKQVRAVELMEKTLQDYAATREWLHLVVRNDQDPWRILAMVFAHGVQRKFAAGGSGKPAEEPARGRVGSRKW
jgi:hypothetical protein